MTFKRLLDLQLFGEGGDGGDGSAGDGASPSGETASPQEDSILASIPEKAKGAYRKALEKNQPKAPSQTIADKEAPEGKLSYADLIKSDDYKEEHKAYMEKTLNDRLKKYKGIEDSNAKMKQSLDIVAQKYGLNSDAEDFLDQLSAKINEDDSYYEQYALDHDISVEEAKKNVNLERRIKVLEAREAEAKRQEAMNQQIMLLRQNAEKTKAQFPDFNLEEQMADEQFRRMCAVTNGDTTAAYMALHWNRVIPGKIQAETAKIQQQMANSVAANKARPIENGMSSQASVVSTPSFKGMTASQMKEYAKAQIANQARRQN